MNLRLAALAVILVVFVGSVAVFAPVQAKGGCVFSVRGTTMKLNADCTTSVTVLVPDGFTLNGAGHTITAVDPPGSHFLGAVVANEGASANVMRLTIKGRALADVCDELSEESDFRLRGILFKGASGQITHNTVTGINQGRKSSCREGAGIEVRNEPFDGTHPNTRTVDVGYNVILNYQMVGVVAGGDVRVSIHHNWIGESAAQATVLASGIQLNKHAMGSVMHNIVDGNQWLGEGDNVGVAILIFNSDNAIVSSNLVRGNSDVGIYLIGEVEGTVDRNMVFDYGPDGPHGDYGIANDSTLPSSAFTNNKVRGFDTPYYGIDPLGSNKVIA